ncbi:hypothetical protein ETB97_001553 [Aspergillus alliaceus]|uniref:Uncharacterized protein n=1 Tax=Petromyces alliaceus TaxID=209559 RepID=A0A5N6FN25_PETAA|nr:Ser-Thr-rich glycosyl-phosphatidyl-inositol-anchored membrane family-domain-containing protein [Aspergillus alliaceus]KAB8231376.1 Ser-Thr-rich glycosyl-phosphatidyl-inositol-anchored membrane family-domain-containing protein [Aspergillus alliaceus]KAF5865975.1 hypothetical protein ETB97_001553 [Aspergillus burnettii]
MISLIHFGLVLAPLVSAISIAKPAANSTYAAGSTITVNWSTVDTDPSEFSLYLWNFVSWPPSYVPLALNVPTSDQSYSVQIPCDTNPEWGYQISAINGTNVYIIHAQGERFTISDAVDGTSCSDPISQPSPSTCGPTTAVSTVYVTVSPTGSSSHLFHHSSHGFNSSHHHHSTHPTPSPSTTSTSSRSVKPGIVPKTIGWCSDYSHPVTLDKVPTPTPAVVRSTSTTTALVTGAPNQIPSNDGVKIVTVTSTVSVAGVPGSEQCPFV